MSEHFKNSFFFLLPNEILIKILDLIKTSALLIFCETYNCDFFLQERNLVKTIDVSKNYDLYNIEAISKKINLNHVSTLNVNCLYWIEAEELRKVISGMVNLETLYAAQTQFSLTSKDTEILSKSKIRKLGVTFYKHHQLGLHMIPSVETLYICVNAVRIFQSRSLHWFFSNLKKVWIVSECGKINLSFINESTKKFFYENHSGHVPCFDHHHLTKYYINTYEQWSICYEKFNDENLVPKSISEGSSDSWKEILDEGRLPKPYSPRDARDLLLNKTTLNEIFFEELNFHRDKNVCYEEYQESIKAMLKSPRSSKLKRLCISMCLFEKEYEAHPSTSKRFKSETSLFHDIEKTFSNFLDLQHLEIRECFRCCTKNSIQGFSLIPMFANLQTLVIEVPLVNENFLSEVFGKCRLKVLKISCRFRSEALDTAICRNISKAKFLVDFTYKTGYIQLDRLFESLCYIMRRNLQRIAIISKNVTDKLSSTSVKGFLEMNPQLVLLYVEIFNPSDLSQLKLIQETMQFYEKKHPCKRFLATTKSNGWSSIPQAHHEMFKLRSNVANLSPLDDFFTF